MNDWKEGEPAENVVCTTYAPHAIDNGVLTLTHAR
jgi:hypothetical protein